MRRPFLGIGVAFAAGIFISRQAGLTPPVFIYFLAAFLPLFLFYRKRPWFNAVLLSVFLSLGGLAEATDRCLPAGHIRESAPGRAALNGRVVSLPEVNRSGKREMVSFVFAVEDIYQAGRLRGASGKIQVFLFNPGASPGYGDRLRLRGDLKIPESALNPGQFDYRRYLENEKIFRIFQGFGAASLRILAPGRPTFLKRVLETRRAIKARLEALCPFPEGEVLSALLIGIRKKIPDKVLDDFARTGTMQVLPTAIRKWDHNPLAGYLTIQAISYLQ